MSQARAGGWCAPCTYTEHGQNDGKQLQTAHTWASIFDLIVVLLNGTEVLVLLFEGIYEDWEDGKFIWAYLLDIRLGRVGIIYWIYDQWSMYVDIISPVICWNLGLDIHVAQAILMYLVNK